MNNRIREIKMIVNTINDLSSLKLDWYGITEGNQPINRYSCQCIRCHETGSNRQCKLSNYH